MSIVSTTQTGSLITGVRHALASADYVSAEAVARRALEHEGATSADRAEAGLLLGRALARTGRLDECISMLTAAVDWEDSAGHPETEVRFDLRRELGQAFWSQGQREEASRWFLAALDVRPDAPDDAELRRLILNLELQALAESGETDCKAEYALEIIGGMVARGLPDDDWCRMLGVLSRSDGLKGTRVDSRTTAWIEEAKAHCMGAGDAKDDTSAQRNDTMATLVDYVERLRRTHPRDLEEADVRELERRFELAWKLMETRQLIDWLGDACNPYFLAHTGWKSIVVLWYRVFKRADRLAGCSGSRAWPELAGAARHLAGWCQQVGEFPAAIRLRRLASEASQSLGDDLSTAIGGTALANTLLVSGDPDAALRALDAEAESHQQDPAARAALGAWARRLRGDILAAMGDLRGAEALFREQLDIDSLEYGQDSARVGWDMLRLAELLADMDRSSDARRLLARAAAAPEDDDDSLLGDRERKHIVRRLRLGRLRLKLDESPEALGDLLARAEEAAELLGRGNAFAAEALTEWAAAMVAAGVHDASVESAASRALQTQRLLRHSEHPAVIRAAEVVRLAGA